MDEISQLVIKRMGAQWFLVAWKSVMEHNIERC